MASFQIRSSKCRTSRDWGFFKEGFPGREAFLFFGHFFTSAWKYLPSPLNLTMTKGWLLPDFGNLSFLNKTNSLLRLRHLVQGLTQVKLFLPRGLANELLQY